MNTIIEINKGIIENVIVVKDSNQALLIYVEMAKQKGVALEKDLIKKAHYDDMSLSELIEEVDKQLLNEGNELKWFEATYIKPIKY